MLRVARRKAAGVRWVRRDLERVTVERRLKGGPIRNRKDYLAGTPAP
jgi:hypothetical protein